MIQYGLTDMIITPKYKGTGTTLQEIIDEDIDYVIWCIENEVFELDNEAFDYLKDEADTQGKDL